MSKINREQAIAAAKLAIEIERFEWRHLWRLRLLRMFTNAGAGFLYGVALALSVDIYAFDFLARHM